jgi:PAS domain S-box-containing protein
MIERTRTLRPSGVKGRLLSIVRPVSPAPSADFAAALVEHLEAAVVACDADGAFVILNRRVREGKDGIPPVSLPLRVPIDQWAEHFRLYPTGGDELLGTEDLPLVRALRGETVRDMELETRAENGARAVLNVSGGPVLDADGQIQGAVVVLQDITDRAEADSALVFDSAVAAHVAVGVGMVRASDGEIVYANEPWERLFGYDHGELIGKHISLINAPTEVTPEQRAQDIFDALERSGEWAGEIHNVRKDGTLLWTACNVSRFEHPEHGTVWISASTDITARKEGDDARQGTAERLQAVFEDAPVGLAVVDASFEVIDANRRLCELGGWRRDELVGRPFARIVHPDDRDLDDELAQRAFAGEIPRYRIEKRLVTKREKELRVALNSTVVRAPDERPLYWVIAVEGD